MENLVQEALDQAKVRRLDSSMLNQCIAFYWFVCYRFTTIIERWQNAGLRNNSRVLNFGCGTNLLQGAINSDLWAPHRYLRCSTKPDLYWTGQSQLKRCLNYFEIIVCEHVLEHILPDVSLKLFARLFESLSEDGVLVLSYPDVRKVLSKGHCQGYAAPIVAANSIIYRHGHSFMYDPELVIALLKSAGFCEVVHSTLLPDQYKSFLVEGRESESIYLIAKK